MKNHFKSFNLIQILTIMLILFALIEIGYSSVQASNKIDVSIDINHEVSNDNKLKINITSNVPNKTNFLVTVSNDELDYTAQDSVQLNNGYAETSWFSSQKRGLKPSKYEVSVTMPLAHTQPESVQKIIGEKGGNLTGEYVSESSIESLGKSANKEVVIDLSLNDENVLDYEIVEITTDNLKVAQGYNYKRYIYRVVINEKAEIENLKETSKYIVEKAKAEKDFNGITLFLYDYEEFAESSYTLGRVQYVPEGEWGKANTVKPGNYEKLDYDWELMKKDWSKQLTPKEVKIWKRHDDLLWNTSMSEERISEKVAEEFNINAEEVDEIFNKKMTWEYMDLKK
ncbi:MAG: hypothetical protein ACOCV1_05200 [Bacillota bacterium]